MAGIIVIYATSVLTNIRAKLVGEFTLDRFGPTEFKTPLMTLAVAEAILVSSPEGRDLAPPLAWWFMAIVTAAGGAQLAISIWSTVREVNAVGATPADTTEWKLEG